MQNEERNWLSFSVIEQLINTRQKHHGYNVFDDLKKPDIDRIAVIEKNILRNSKRMTNCFAEWMMRVAMAYQEKYAGTKTGEIEMSYWIRLQALAHAIIDHEKDYPRMPDKLSWEEEPASLDVMSPESQDFTEIDTLADPDSKRLEKRIEDLEHLVHFLLKQKGHNAEDVIEGKKSIH